MIVKAPTAGILPSLDGGAVVCSRRRGARQRALEDRVLAKEFNLSYHKKEAYYLL